MININNIVKEYAILGISKGLDNNIYDVVNLYRVFYDEHKRLNGSFKKYIPSANHYEDKMDQRYSYIDCKLNEELENIIGKNNGKPQKR